MPWKDRHREIVLVPLPADLAQRAPVREIIELGLDVDDKRA
jgi:hypothetical protein